MFSTGSVVAALFFMLIGAGCSNNAFPTQDSSTNLNLGNGNNISAGENTPIPANFPADVPQYPGARTKLAYGEASGAIATLVQETTDTPSQVRISIEQTMKQNGFIAGEVISGEQAIILGFAKGTIRYQINIAQKGTTTTIQSIRMMQ